jgi:putative transposase
MNSPETYDGFDAYDEDDLAFFEEDYPDDLELPSQDESSEQTNAVKSGSRHQPSALSISCYGAPEEDTSVEFLDERFALEEEITLPSGEKVRLQLTNEQQQRLEVIRNLAQARHNRQIFSQRLGEGAEKLGLSRRQVRRIFQDWVNEGLASLQKASRLDQGKPRRSEYWYELSKKIYKEGNKGTSSLTRTQAADKIRTQAYEYTKLELRSDILKLQENGLQGEDLDRELGKLIEQREEACKQSRQAIQEEITQLKKKISELHKKKLDTRGC